MDSGRNSIKEIKDMLDKLNSIKYKYELEETDNLLIIKRYNFYYKKWDILHEINYGTSCDIEKDLEYVRNFIKNMLTVEK